MGFGYQNTYNGLEIVAKPATTSNTLGDLEVLTSTKCEPSTCAIV